MAFKLNLDGIYIPAFDKSQIISRSARKKKFEILGSAHNLKEIKIKEKQGCTTIFLSPIFKVNKSNYYLDIIKFNVCLGLIYHLVMNAPLRACLPLLNNIIASIFCIVFSVKL